jgi:prevent-host-death family protein
MAIAKTVSTSAGELVRQFSHYSDVALSQAVVVTRNGRPRNVLLSVEEYERLKRRDQQAFLAADTPEHFLSDIEELAGSEKR